MSTKEIGQVVERVIAGAINPRKHDEAEYERLCEEASDILWQRVDSSVDDLSCGSEGLFDILNEWVHSGEAGI